MIEKKRDFDEAAASWDEKPARVKLAQDIGTAIENLISFKPDMDLLDFGCGTGLLSLPFQSQVRSITGIDNSPGMLDVFNQKVAGQKWDHVTSLLVDLDQGEQLQGSYDVVLSSMTLHHIKDLKSLFEQFYRIVFPGGLLCVADLDPDGGKFHTDNTGIFHHGFERAELHQMFKDAGFEDIQDADAVETVREGVDGLVRNFKIFVMSGRK